MTMVKWKSLHNTDTWYYGKLNKYSSISLFTSIKQDQQYSLPPEPNLAKSRAGNSICVRGICT